MSNQKEGLEKAIYFILIAWGILIIPLIIMIIFILTGHGEFQAHSETSWNILYYMTLLSPIILIGSSIWSYILLKKKKYYKSLLISLIPFIGILLEVILLDIILWFI